MITTIDSANGHFSYGYNKKKRKKKKGKKFSPYDEDSGVSSFNFPVGHTAVLPIVRCTIHS